MDILGTAFAGKVQPCDIVRPFLVSSRNTCFRSKDVPQCSPTLRLARKSKLCAKSKLVEQNSRRQFATVTYAQENGGEFESHSEESPAVFENPGRLAEICSKLASVFPLWVIIAAALALRKPTIFTWIKGNVMVAALVVTMLGMGTTLTLDDLKQAFSMPKQLIAGVLLQYTVMPTMGYVISSFMGLPEHYAVGIILVACCPGGTASNVVTYLARGNVALSVLMTAASTVLATIMTPILTSVLAGKFVNVDGLALFLSTIQVVLLPVLIGALSNHLYPVTVRQVSQFAPLVAVIAVAALVGSAVASNAAAIASVSGIGPVLLAVLCLHGGGFLWGYVLSHVLGFEVSTSRTISIEVGMQNSVLGVLLASQHFSNPLTAAPCAISSVVHSLLGSLLAAFWRLSDEYSERSK